VLDHRHYFLDNVSTPLSFYEIHTRVSAGISPTTENNLQVVNGDVVSGAIARVIIGGASNARVSFIENRVASMSITVYIRY